MESRGFQEKSRIKRRTVPRYIRFYKEYTRIVNHWAKVNEALHNTLALNFMPVVITSVTTSIGFLTLNFSDVPILVDLGNLTAMGVMLACVLALTLLPAMLKILPVKPPQQTSKKPLPWLTGFGEWVITYHRRVLPYTAIVFVTTLILASTNQLNDIAIK